MGSSFQSLFSKGIECNLSFFFSFSHSFKKCWLNAWHVVRRERKKKNVIESSSGTMETRVQLEALMLWIKEFIVLLIIAVVKDFPPKCVLGEEAF